MKTCICILTNEKVYNRIGFFSSHTNLIATSSLLCMFTPATKLITLVKNKLTRYEAWQHERTETDERSKNTTRTVPRYSSPKDPLPIFLPSLNFPPITCSIFATQREIQERLRLKSPLGLITLPRSRKI